MVIIMYFEFITYVKIKYMITIEQNTGKILGTISIKVFIAYLD